MDSIKVLIIGKDEWVEKLSKRLERINECFIIEKIKDEVLAKKRLQHNSYNILILQDNFSSLDPIRLASLAYAMTRPSIIVCSNIFKYIWFRLKLSKIYKLFKTSKKLINFNFGLNNIEDDILTYSKDYMQYFNTVNEEIQKNTL